MGEIRPSGQILQRPCLLGPESCPAHCRPEGQALLRCLSPRRNPEITSLTVGLRRLRAFALTSQEAPAEAMLLPQCTRSTPPRCTRTPWPGPQSLAKERRVPVLWRTWSLSPFVPSAGRKEQSASSSSTPVCRESRLPRLRTLRPLSSLTATCIRSLSVTL